MCGLCNVQFLQTDLLPSRQAIWKPRSQMWPRLIPPAILEVGGMISTCSFNVTVWGLGWGYLQRTAESLVPGPGLEAGTRTRGSWLPAQNTSRWISLSTGCWKFHSHRSGWKVDSYLNTRLQTSSCIKALHIISTRKLPNLVKDGREAGKKERRQSGSHTSERRRRSRVSPPLTGLLPPSTEAQPHQ